MIRLYDIGRNEKYKCPKLLIKKTFRKEIDIKETIEFINFVNEDIKLNKYDNEHVYLITTDYYDNIIGVFLISVGDFKGCEVYPRNIATAVLLSGARKFLIMHNHPDGALLFSESDISIVSIMKGISILLETEFINSYIFTAEGYITYTMDSPMYFDQMEE
jgi:DNA repair protein RadC